VEKVESRGIAASRRFSLHVLYIVCLPTSFVVLHATAMEFLSGGRDPPAFHGLGRRGIMAGNAIKRVTKHRYILRTLFAPWIGNRTTSKMEEEWADKPVER
jgi:hypothetical protein